MRDRVLKLLFNGEGQEVGFFQATLMIQCWGVDDDPEILYKEMRVAENWKMAKHLIANKL